MGTEIGQSLIIQLFKQFKKKKINEIYTATRWDAVAILSFFKSVGFDRSNLSNFNLHPTGEARFELSACNP